MMRYAAFLVASVVCALYTAFCLEVRTPITEFLPQDERSRLLQLARELSSSAQSRVMVFTTQADTKEASRALSGKLRDKLVESGAFEWVRSEVASADQSEAYGLFFPPRLGLAQLPPGTGPVSDAFLEERVAALKQRLTSPMGMLERRLAPEDPLGFFLGYLERQQAGKGNLRLEDGQFVTEDGFYVILAATKAPAFETEAQVQVEALVLSTFDALRAQDASLKLDYIGVNRFAIEGERSVRGDIERISTLSLFGIFLLYWLIFRSLREPLLVMLPITFGCLLAVAACQLVFGFVHGLTLAFGSAIIGVAEDYSVHFFSHRVAVRGEPSEALMRRLWPGMWMGGLTTMAGIGALALSGFPGLMQMSLFGVVGVFGALISTRYLLPGLSRKDGRPTHKSLSAWGEKLGGLLSFKPRSALWFALPALLVTVAGVPFVQWRDGLSSLRTPTPELDATNARIQQRLGRGAGGRMVVALGKDDEAALEAVQRAEGILAQAKQDGLVRDYRGPAGLLPPVAEQERTRARLTQDASLEPRLSKVLEEQGFVAAAFAPFFEQLKSTEPSHLTPDALLGSAFADLLLPFRAQLEHEVAYLTQVDTEDSNKLEALFAEDEQLFYVDQEALFNAAYGAFRSRTLSLVWVGLVLVLGTLLLRYRNLALCLGGMVPALLGGGAALGVQGLLGIPATLMHVIGLLLVLSMGVDYGIYMLESRGDMEEGVVTLGSVALAALTTVLSFGLLGLSANPALAGIGLTVSLGLVFSVLASPVVLVWSMRREPCAES